MKQITWRERARYAFDNTMSKGAIALIAWLFLLSLGVIIVISGIVVLTGIAPATDDGSPPGFLQVAWMSLMRTLDAGTMGGDAGSWAFLMAMLAVTFGGIFVVSTLIGILTSGIESKIEDLRKGRSFVVEKNHTIILGWSDHIFTIISELVLANENQPRSCIVILADTDKVKMEDEIRDKVPKTGRTKIVCRTGSPIDLSDLEIVNPNGAKSIIVLSPQSEDPDSYVIKSILALTNNPNRREEPYHIVAEIHDPKNLEVARMVGRNEAQLLLVGELISRITVQTCRQSGLSVVYTELLDFGGDEIYFKEEPGLVGSAFGDALFRFEDSVVMGLRFADGRIVLNPPMDTKIGTGDKVIAISQDDDTIRLSSLKDFGVDASAISSPAARAPKPERTLILGWNWRAPMMINELENYVAAGSEVLVVADSNEPATAIPEQCGHLKNQAVRHQQADTTNRRVLESLGLTGFDHIIVLSYSDQLGHQEADAKTLITLLHLREIATQNNTSFSIVSEMLDLRNRELAEVTRADDFIVSERLISLMLSQISENKELEAVFRDLFDPEGSELYLKRASDYVLPGRQVNFYTIVEAARRRGEVAIGYRIKADSGNAAKSYGVRVNPKKSDKITFAEGDRVIVLAEN